MQRADQVAVFGTGERRRSPLRDRAGAPGGRQGAQRRWRRSRRAPAGLALAAKPHNLQNAAVAVAVAEALLTRAQWAPAMATFRGLPHRMERVAEANGVLFINDSKDQSASTAPALPSSSRRSGGSTSILGGLPKAR